VESSQSNDRYLLAGPAERSIGNTLFCNWGIGVASHGAEYAAGSDTLKKLSTFH
jgi:hypothetical protein